MIIRRHLRLISLAKTKILDEREILDAQATMVHLAQAIQARVETLDDSTFEIIVSRDRESRMAYNCTGAICSDKICIIDNDK